MFIDPPTRDFSRFVDGTGPRPRNTNLTTSDIYEYVASYRAAYKRDERTCADCGREHLYQPNLKLGVIDDSKPLYDENNLQCLCYACARKRESAKNLTTADQTGFVRDDVVEREGRRCVYCLRGPLYGEHAVLVSRVDIPDTTDPSDWACSCKTCKNERGSLSHDEYGRRCAENAADLAAYLHDTFTE